MLALVGLVAVAIGSLMFFIVNETPKVADTAEKQFWLGMELYQKGNRSEAFKIFTEAAEQENPLAQFLLAICYHNGDGVAVNKDESIMWLHKSMEGLRNATERGDAQAQVRLAGVYKTGWGLPNPDEDEASKWYSKAVKGLLKAAKKGDKEAQIALGMLYMEGHGVAFSHAEAVKWLRKAAAQGYEDYVRNQLGFPEAVDTAK